MPVGAGPERKITSHISCHRLNPFKAGLTSLALRARSSIGCQRSLTSLQASLGNQHRFPVDFLAEDID